MNSREEEGEEIVLEKEISLFEMFNTQRVADASVQGE